MPATIHKFGTWPSECLRDLDQQIITQSQSVVPMGTDQQSNESLPKRIIRLTVAAISGKEPIQVFPNYREA
jgi:hypothetical protein